MTKWCENRLLVAGDRELLEDFKTKVANGRELLDFRQLVPSLSDCEARVKNWGYMWNPDWLVDMEGTQSLDYRFDTTWEPPLDWLRQAATLYPRLKFTLRFEEPWTQLAGMVVFENGRLWNRCRV